MTARGPYYASLDAWVAQKVGGSTQYGNGEGTLAHVGPVPSATDGDPDFKSRMLIEISAADIAAALLDATSVDDFTLTVTVGANTCLGTRGATMRMFAEEMTTAFGEKPVSGCSLSSGSGTSVWGISNSVTTTNRAFHSSASPALDDELDFDITDIMQARLAAEDYSVLRFRLIAANSDGSGYDEETNARRISFCTREHATTTKRPKLNGNITIGSVPKTLTAESGTGTEAFTVAQSGTSPSFSESGVGTDAFTGGVVPSWDTYLDTNNNGVGRTTLASANSEGLALLDGVSEQDVQLHCKFRVDKVPQGGAGIFRLVVRAIDKDNYYRVAVSINALHSMSIVVDKKVAGVTTVLQTIPDIRTLLAQTDYWIKLNVSGVSPTTILAKLWRADDAEPGWLANVDDSEASLQTGGTVGVGARIGAVSNAPIAFSFDQLEGVAP